MHGLDVRFIAYWFIGIIFVIVVATNASRSVLKRRRTKALAAVAREIGFELREDNWLKVGAWNQPPVANQMSTALFLTGMNRRFNNIMTGTAAALQVSLFDYSTSGKSASTQTVAAYTQKLSLPFFEMQPGGFVWRAADALFHQNINFDSHPNFWRRYAVRGLPVGSVQQQDNHLKIQELFSTALLTFLAELPPKSKWNIEGAGPTLVIYRTRATVRADELHSFLDESSSIASAFFNLCGLKKSAA
jgi:hypothetical protein